MAWVSVHDTVDGRKRRELAKSIGCTKEEALGTLVSLWMWGLKNADKFGRIISADKTDILDAFSMKLVAKIPNVVDLLIENGWIDVENEKDLVIHDWDQWQALWYKANERRESDARRKKKERLKKRGTADEPEQTRETADYQTTEATEEAENMSFLPKDEKPVSKYSEGFESFWKAYPRKIDKGNAYKKYSARRKDGFSDEELIEAATAYAGECNRLHTEQNYIKHPKTFLSDSLPFTDYIKKKPTSSAECQEPNTADPFAEWGEP